jgi:threonine synthase
VKYVSTRGQAPVLLFDDVLLAGLARDGGLYVPETWPRLKRGDIRGLRGLSYADLAVRVMTPFIGGRIGEAEFAAMVADTYAAFTHPAIAPMKQLAGDHWLMELFHGPTLSFKDYALQLVGRMFDHVLARKGRRATIVGATSGDTGSAAIEACRDRNAIDVFILHPKDRVSEVQRRQMTTVDAANIYNIAIEGTFDDCQDLVKAMFNDTAFRDRHDLSAVNSINWARIMAQTAFYFAAAVSMGLPIERLIVGSNANDILNRFFASGKLAMNQVVPTLSPSMDIQVSSNFERLLFELYGREGVRLATVMDDFRASGMMDVGQARWERACALFEGHRRDDSETEAVMRRLYETTGEMVDPHTAIGIAAGEAAAGTVDAAIVSMATAHPAKFPDAVEEATGVRPALPRHLADLNERPERCHALPNDLDAVRGFVAETLGGSTAA